METHILIIGAGAVGAYFGSRLHQPGKSAVSVVCRSNYDAVHTNGFQLSTARFGSYSFRPKTFSSVQAAAEQDYDHIIVTTKQVNADIPTLIRPAVTAKTMIHLIQNGIDIEHVVQTEFPYNSISSGVTYIAVTQTAPGIIQQPKGIEDLYLGLFQHDEAARDKLALFIELAKQGGLNAFGPVADIQEVRWHKLLWNGSFNPVSILAGGKNCKQLLDCTETRQLILAMMTEISAVAAVAMKRPFAAHLMTVETYMAKTANLGEYKPSMLLDWENGRPIELEAILGNLIRIAKRLNISVDRCDTVYCLLKCMMLKV